MYQDKIIFFTLIFALCGACIESTSDLVVQNARVLTVDSEFSEVEAVAILDGVFIAVGSNEEAIKDITSLLTVVNGKVVYESETGGL